MHRSYATVAAVDGQQQVVLTARRIDSEEFEAWIRKHVRRTDVVMLEATSNAWHLYELLVPRVASVTVANPIQVALIAKSRVKTDPRCAHAGTPAGSRAVAERVGAAGGGARVARPE